MSSLLDKFSNFSWFKFLGRVFLVLLMINLVIGVDLVMTGNGFVGEDIGNIVPKANWYVVSSDVLRFDITLNFPNEGFIPKGAQLNMQLFISHPQSSVVNDVLTKNQLVFGELLELQVILGLSSSLTNLFEDTGYLEYKIIIQFIPQYLGMTLDSGLRTLSVTGNVGYVISAVPN